LTDAELAKQVMTNMGFLPSTVAAITQLEIELAAYFGGMGKDNRGYVVLQLSDILSTLTADATYGAIATAWNAEVAASVAASVPGSFSLTTATTDNLVGSSGDDIFSAISSALAAAGTLNVTDKVNGGTGNDTFNIGLDTNFAGFTSGSVAGVEKFVLTNTSGSDRTFSAVGVSGATEFTIDAAKGNVVVSNAPTGLKTVTVSNLLTPVDVNTVGVNLIAGAAELADTATADALALNLNTVGSTKTVTLDFAKFETLNVAQTGTNKVTFKSDGGTKTINVTGTGKFTVDNVASATTKFDASAVTGAVAVTLSAATAVSTVKTGSAVDTITAAVADDLVANATIDGGAGATDTLKLSLTAAAGAQAVEYKMTGVEVLSLGNVGSALTMSGAATTGLSTVSIAAVGTGTTIGTAAKVEMVNMSGDLTFESLGDSSTAADINSDHAGASTVTYTAAGTAAAAKTGADTPQADFTFSNSAGPLTVNVGAYINGTTSSVTANKASTVTLNVATGPNAVGTELTVFDSVITANKATTITVKADGQLASGAQIAADKATTATVTNGASTGELNLNTKALTALDVNTGAALDMATASTLTALQTLTIAANKGLTKIGNLTDISTVGLSGAATSSAVTLGILGDTTHDYGITVTATGLKGGLQLGNTQVSKGFDTSINVAGVTGNVKIGTVNADSTIFGKGVDVKAAGVGGTFEIGAVVGTGVVSVDASNVVGVATIGNLTGDSVTSSVKGSASGSTIGQTYSVISGATLSTHELAAATAYTVTAQATSKALTVSLTGGLNAETLNVNGGAATTSITVSGNLGAGDDIVNLVSTGVATAQTLSLAGVVSYKTGAITSGAGADTITGGAGADTIKGGAGADTLTGGDGVDVFHYELGNSSYLTPDTIVDLKAEDKIVYGGANPAKATAITTGTGIRVDDNAVVSFSSIVTATDYDQFAEKVELIDTLVNTPGHSVFFQHDGSTYMFIETNNATTDNATQDATTDIVIKLTGVSLPTTATTFAAGTNGSGTDTGLSGFGA